MPPGPCSAFVRAPVLSYPGSLLPYWMRVLIPIDGAVLSIVPLGYGRGYTGVNRSGSRTTTAEERERVGDDEWVVERERRQGIGAEPRGLSGVVATVHRRLVLEKR